jgi:hypothetical protein
MASSQKRSKQIKLTITPDMHARLVALGERLGQAPATLASMAISLYVAQQESSLNAGQRAVDAMVGQMAPELQHHLRDLLTLGEEAEPEQLGIIQKAIKEGGSK